VNELVLVILTAMVCGVATYGVAKRMVSCAGRVARPDLPDARRLHAEATPRGGGIGLLLFVPVAAFLARPAAPECTWTIAWWLFGFALPNGLIGAVDDWRPLPSELKLTIQLVVAYVYVSAGFSVGLVDFPPFSPLSLGWAAPWLTTLWLVWATNVFNFMDGIDALAGVSGAIFMMALAVLSTSAPGSDVGVASTCIMAGCSLTGFLILNRPPARIFMGDGGALFVGAVLAGATVLLSGPTTRVPSAAPLLVMGPFLFDATYTLIRRLLAGKRVLDAHCSHLYQRLARGGWSHARVRSIYFGLNVAAGCGALLLVHGGTIFHSLVWATAIGAAVGLVAITRHVEHRRILLPSELGPPRRP
jgi:UDP-N-acetylmuramyl pentapeptide phosphotransferase/UDP-N-acetylglucosamine-1-phosphate transferase